MANKKIYEFDSHSSIDDTDVLPISATASWNAEKSTAAELKDYVKTGITTADVTASTDKNYVTDAQAVVIWNTSWTNTGDQDLSWYATKANVLELNNTTPFTPDADYEPATKKYVDDNSWSGGDVTWPASSTANHIPQFADISWKVLKDWLWVVTTLWSPWADTNIPTEAAVRAAISTAGGWDVSWPASSTDWEVPLFNWITGKVLKNSSKTVVATLWTDDTTIPTSKAVKDVTDWLVTKALYDANTVLAATTDNTPAAVTVDEQTFVGRKTGWNIAALTATEARTILNVADWATANTKATGAELDTGTDDDKFATAKALKDSHNVPSVAPWTSGNVLTSDGTDWISSAATWWGGLTKDQWFALTGSYASTSTFTFTGTAAEAKQIERCLLTCTDSAGTTRRIWYIKSASESGWTVTATVVTDSDLASWDKDFKITPSRKITDYRNLVTIPWEVIADASYSQWMWYRPLVASYLLPVNSMVRTAAAWTGAACAWNVYANSSNLFSSAQDMTTSATFDEKRPTTNTTAANDIITFRITSSAGNTNKASDFQAELYIVPQNLFTSF